MLKYLAGLVLVFGLAIYISVQDERAAQQTTPHAAQLSKSALPAEADENHSQQNVPNPERNAPRWYRFFRWGDGTTTWVIVFTLLAIAEQAHESAKATLAMQRSIALQEVSMKQWIEVTNWHSEEQLRDIRGKPTLMIYFDILNPTDRVVTLTGMEWNIGKETGNETLNAVVPPKKAHPTIIGYSLTHHQAAEFESQIPVKFSVAGNIGFTDALGTPQRQPFWVSLHCGIGNGIIIIKQFETAAWTLPTDKTDS